MLKNAEHPMSRTFVSWSHIFIVGIVGIWGLCCGDNAFAQRGNPENPSWYDFKAWGEIKGPLPPDSCNRGDERFGQGTFVLIGKVGGVPAWIISHLRCDTSFREWDLVNTPPSELLLYRGVRNGLPTGQSGQRIGPDEINYDTRFIAAGDFDADGNVDIATDVRLLNDTNFNNFRCYMVSDVVIWWGDSVGSYTTKDTTHLSCGHRKWFGVNGALGHGLALDLSGDGIDDLVLTTDAAYDSLDKYVLVPPLQLFAGGNGSRWGRGSSPSSRLASWWWWNAPPAREMKALDHDCDGHLDIAFIDNESTMPGSVAILYGDSRGLPDTADLQTIHMDTINGKYMIFADVTGDGVPELIANTGGVDILRIYAGKVGQRLINQYGKGLAAPDPTHGRPWSLPWAEVWLPHLIHDGWDPAGFQEVYSVGDINNDGIGDIIGFSDPYLVFYTSGPYLDSLIDAEIDTRGMSFIFDVVPMGDVDGSGVKSFAVLHGMNPGGVLFYKPSSQVPTLYYTDRELPHPPGFRCEHAATVRLDTASSVGSNSLMNLTCNPNPATAEVRLSWRSMGNETTVVLISTEVGDEAHRVVLPRDAHEYLWNVSGWSSGVYFVTVRCAGSIETKKVILQ
jgi:hypothetical protein